MRPFGFILFLIAGAVTADNNRLDTLAIGTIANSIAKPRENMLEYADAFRQLAKVLQDKPAERALDNPPGSKEYQQALHTLRSDISRAQWLFYDDKTVSDSLSILASRLESAY
ncbi:hypothetical protein LPJ56_000349 [Coemansia sp. RSA 2599]|nr:hypothetical protein LPJ75_000137 [Coemansia sp. RSA 2598]KAJ1829407.1 hypothetical protein LPJ56_000349 [Coemansia sp. RSA 2599]